MVDLLTQLIEELGKLIEWWIESGLAYSTALAGAKIADYVTSVLIPLLYQYVNTIFGA